MPAKNNAPLLTIEGHLEHITYSNAQTQYTVARLKPLRAAGAVTIVGYLAGVHIGETLQVRGTWTHHPKYGQQLKIHSYDVVLPATVDGIRTFLESGGIKGIGPSLAGRLVQTFGADTLRIIEKAPQRLCEVTGIGDSKADMIHSCFRKHQALKDIMRFLQEVGAPASLGVKIYKQYGAGAQSLIREDPYILARDFAGPGFLAADAVARAQGLDLEDPERVRACILHIVRQNLDDGHTFAEQQNLVARCEHLFQITADAICDGINELATAGEIVAEELVQHPPCRAIYLRQMHRAEIGLAERLQAMLAVPVTPIALEAERIAAEIHRKLAINLSAEQLAVVAQVLSHRLAIITGGPGTGKTTLLRSISTLFEDAGKRVLLAAPTGRAARRLAEVTGRAAGTIHRLLGYNFTDGGFMRHRDHPLDADAIIVDEASMIDTLLMYHLVDAVPISAVLILVGDVAQLPSVGAGSVLADMIRSRSIPVFYLNKIFRQAQQSSIVVNAHKVRQGEMPVFEFNDHLKGTADFRFIEQPDPQQVADRIVQLCREELPNEFNFDPLADIQVLTPMHKGVVGTINLNQLLQKALNPRPVLVEAMGNTFRIGDKVMHLKNNYHKEVYNGDIGRIMAIDRQQNEMVVDYYGRSVTYDFEELDEVAMAYAVSVHKSQGSEYPAVVVPILTQHYILLHRNLLYTAITRGRKQVILIGTRKALAIALKNDKPQQRLSGLAARLNTN